MAEDDGPVRHAHGPGGQHILPALEPVELGADQPGGLNPAADEQGHDDGEDSCPEEHDEQRHDHHPGEGLDDLADAHEHHVHLPAVVAGDGAVHHADDHVGHHRDDGDEQGHPGSPPQPGPQIPAQVVRAEPEGFLAAGIGVVVHLHVGHQHAVDLVLIGHRQDTALGILLRVVQAVHPAVGEDPGAVGDAHGGQEGDLGGHVQVVHKLLVKGVGRHHGPEDRHKGDQQDQHQGRHRRLVPCQAQHGVLEKADGGRVELGVLQVHAQLQQLKVILPGGADGLGWDLRSAISHGCHLQSGHGDR